jgi:hypothetical protein
MVKVTEKYYIDADSKNYVIKEKYQVQDEKSENYGADRYKEIAYCTSLKDAIDRVLTLNVRSFISKSEQADLKELVAEVRRQTEYIESLKLDV